MKKQNSGLIISLIIGTVISSFYWFNLLEPFELSLGYDSSFVIKKSSSLNPKVKIIGIDQKSLDLIGEYPWRRSLYTDLLKYLGDKPKVIGFDIILPEHSAYPEDDILLAEEIKKNKNVVLPVSLEPDIQDPKKLSFIYPLEELSNASKALGLIHYFPDLDGITRKTPIRENIGDKNEYINIFSYHIANIFLNNKIIDLPDYIYCNFQTRENNYEIYSFYDVVSNKVKAEEFKDSIVLIGATAEGLQDRISSPIGPMYGVLYHGQLISNILNRDYITPVPKIYNVFFIMFVSIFAYFIWKYFETINQVLLIILSFATLYLLHYLLFNDNIWVSIFSILVSNTLTFISLILYEQLKISLSLKTELDKLILGLSNRNLDYEVTDSNFVNNEDVIKSNANRVEKLAKIGKVLTTERDFLQTLLNNINNPILVTDNNSAILLSNPMAERFLSDKDDTVKHLVGKRLVDLTNNMPDFKSDLIAVYNRKKSLPLSLNYERGDSVYNIKLINLENKEDDLNVICMIEDVSNWHHMANKDGLTGLWNQRYFKDYLTKEIHKSLRYKNPLSLIMMDVDHFKSFNDTYGHQTGDIVLKSIAKVLEKSQRNTDIAARYGGEEFALILTMTDEKGAAIFAERLRKEIESLKLVDINGNPVRQVTSSLGIAFYNSGSVSDFIELADEALYACKDRGRNCVTTYSQLEFLNKAKKE